MNMPYFKIDFREQKDKIFIILVVIIVIFVGRKILDGQNLRIANTRDKISSYERGVELATEISKVGKGLEKFKNAGWQTQESVSIMGAINEVASKYNIEILTFDPGNLRDEKHYFTLSMVLNIRGSYFDLMKFLSALEDLTTLTKISSLQITSGSDIAPQGHGSLVQANLNIVAFILKK